MTAISCFMHGMYPRSEKLSQISRDVERGRQTQSELGKQQREDKAVLAATQQSLSFSFLEDGKLLWQDIFRPIVAATSGMEVGALARWFDNNTFYRQPIIAGKLRLHPQKLHRFFPRVTPQKKWKVTIPSPFTFAKLASDETTTSFEKTLGKIVVLIGELIAYLTKRGIAAVQLNEPYIPYHGVSPKERALFIRSLKEIAIAKSDLAGARRKVLLAVHFYFGDAAPIVISLHDNSFVDIIGVDFYKTNLLDLPQRLPQALIAGIIDGRNSLLEDEKSLQVFVQRTIKRLAPPSLYLSNNSDLELLPKTVAAQKLALLGKVATNF